MSLNKNNNSGLAMLSFNSIAVFAHVNGITSKSNTL